MQRSWCSIQYYITIDTKAHVQDSFENIFNKLGNFDKSLNYQVDLLNFSFQQTFPSFLRFETTFS